MKSLFLFLVSGLFMNAAAGETMVTASVGEDVILPCKLTHSFKVGTLRVEWIHDGGQKTEDVHLYRKGDDDLHDQDKNFKHRTSVFPEEMSRGNISLKLTKVTELDAGKYSCNVKTQNIAEAFTACSVTLEAVLPSEDGSSRGENVGISTRAVIGVSFSVVVGICVGLLLMSYRKNRMCAAEEDDSKTSTTV